jgi:hypothetical protein
MLEERAGCEMNSLVEASLIDDDLDTSRTYFICWIFIIIPPILAILITYYFDRYYAIFL